MELSKKEEELMEIIWRLEHSFMKDILDEYPEPKPAATTIATLLKRLQDKKFIDFEVFGNSRRYFAKVKKDKYFSKQLKGLIENFFNNSAIQFASFFTSSTNLTKKELEDLKKLVDKEIQKKD
ncbi:MAG: BlaI/MecI/CopY family transcriptional regulator [Flavobacteriia bacterium]|nr:BlaI/MecI/CopY family transcriptional regulator [Flavobacteriia bacterium]